MQKRRLPASDIEISAIIMGAWQAGKEYWVGIDDGESTRAIRAALDAGITTFDTAEDYGSGHSERILGAALEDVRDRVVLLTKVWATNLRRDQVFEACERSLANLRTDWIDLYQIHWPSGTWGSDKVAISETMGALKQLKEQGKIRAIGVSNFSVAELKEARSFATIASCQPPYSLFWRHAEDEKLPYCVEHDIAILAYSPLAQGLLTGRFDPGHRFAASDPRADNKLFLPEHQGAVRAALAELETMAKNLGCSMAQLALAWVIAQPNTCAIAGARSAEQVRDNAGAADIELSAGDLAELDRIGQSVAARFAGDPMPWTWES